MPKQTNRLIQNATILLVSFYEVKHYMENILTLDINSEKYGITISNT